MLKNILSIHGQAGLFKLVSRSSKIIIVESLSDHRRMPVTADRKIISLDDIAIYTDTQEKPLREVFTLIKEHEAGKEITLNPKSEPDVLRNWFSEILPDFDRDRVYPTDIKKIIVWYNHLLESGLTDFDSEQEV